MPMSFRGWLLLATCALPLLPAIGAEHPPAALLNPTGKALNLPVPVRMDSTVLGEVVITIDEHDQVLLAATDLTPHLNGHLPETTISSLQGFGPTPLPLTLFAGIGGLELGFDQQAMEVTIDIPADQTRPRALSLSPKTLTPSLMEPATVSAFVNYTLSVTHDWSYADASGFTLDLESASRIGGVVLEAEASLGGALNGFLCPIEAACRDQQENLFRRRGTRLVYDMADWNTRLVAGDTSYWGLPQQRSVDLLGLSLAHDRDTFGNHSRATRSFNQPLLIERSADLELFVNGTPMQRLKLQPGAYSLQDLPITLGASLIEAVVTYDTGEREVFQFNALSAHQILDAGEVTWNISGGLPSTWIDGERAYLDTFSANGFIRQGLTDTLTASLSAQTDSTVHNAGFGLHHLFPWGTIHLGAIFSHSGVFGYAATAAYETLPDLNNPQRSFRIAADCYSPDFRLPGDAQLLASDILYPTHDTWLDLTAVLTQPLFWNSYATATGRYAFAAEKANLPGAVSAGIDRWTVDLGITQPIYETATLTFTAGYGNDRLLSFADLDQDPELRFGIALVAHFGASHVSALHSFGNDHTTVNASRHTGTASDLWQANVYSDNAPERGNQTSASVGHLGAWGDTRITQTFQQPQDRDATHRTELQHGGAIALADGKLAMGAPVRDGFAIVYPHASISDATVIVGNAESPRATGSSWWPALVSDLPAYSHVQYPLDATDIPDGYGLGTSNLSVKSPYHAGYAVPLGSDMPLTAYGTLLDASGVPVALQSGKATLTAHPGRSVDVFTNSAGRFAAEGLAAGDWIITIAAADYRFTIPAETRGLYHADILVPVEAPILEVPPSPWPTNLITEAQ